MKQIQRQSIFSKCFTLLIFTLSFLKASAQSPPQPKREFRAVWIATVDNIDWPSSKKLDPSLQKQEFIRMLDSLKKDGLNCVIVQVRCAADALYAKSREPWSEWLTGTQGKAPDPFYDPLQFFIEEAHKRSMEIHAWLNPYRAVFDIHHSTVARNSIINKNPGWFFNFGSTKLFNPGIPQVRKYIVGIVMDLVRNYDIDGIHIDDYFYPYPEKRAFLQDQDIYEHFGDSSMSIEDWRRNNVNQLIQTMHDSIGAAKPFVKFGISPFGIWRNNSDDPLGSDTHGFSSYNGLYADTRLWMKNQWMDYINPQDYWYIGYYTAPYEELVRWWAKNSFGRPVIIGIAAYKVGTSGPWRSKTQFGDQMRISRSYPEVKGQDFFNTRTLLGNKMGIADSLRNNFYRYPALMPRMNERDTMPPLAPQKLAFRIDRDGIHLNWQAPPAARDGDLPRYYVIYRFENQEPVNLDDPRHILKVIFQDTSYIDNFFSYDRNYFYVVTSLDRVQNESLGTSNVYVNFQKEKHP